MVIRDRVPLLLHVLEFDDIVPVQRVCQDQIARFNLGLFQRIHRYHACCGQQIGGQFPPVSLVRSDCRHERSRLDPRGFHHRIRRAGRGDHDIRAAHGGPRVIRRGGIHLRAEFFELLAPSAPHAGLLNCPDRAHRCKLRPGLPAAPDHSDHASLRIGHQIRSVSRGRAGTDLPQRLGLHISQRPAGIGFK